MSLGDREKVPQQDIRMSYVGDGFTKEIISSSIRPFILHPYPFLKSLPRVPQEHRYCSQRPVKQGREAGNSPPPLLHISDSASHCQMLLQSNAFGMYLCACKKPGILFFFQDYGSWASRSDSLCELKTGDGGHRYTRTVFPKGKQNQMCGEKLSRERTGDLSSEAPREAWLFVDCFDIMRILSPLGLSWLKQVSFFTTKVL